MHLKPQPYPPREHRVPMSDQRMNWSPADNPRVGTLVSHIAHPYSWVENLIVILCLNSPPASWKARLSLTPWVDLLLVTLFHICLQPRPGAEPREGQRSWVLLYILFLSQCSPWAQSLMLQCTALFLLSIVSSQTTSQVVGVGLRWWIHSTCRLSGTTHPQLCLSYVDKAD